MKLVIANKNYSRYYRWPHADGQMGGEPSKNQGTASSRSTLLGPTIKEMKLELQTTSFYGKARSEAFASYQDVIDMHDEAVAALHGRERVIESAAARGDLKARAGVNYKLLGEARMVEAPRWSVDARLRSVADGQAFGERGADRMNQGPPEVAVSTARTAGLVGFWMDARTRVF
jgi:hypothetical protein